MGWNKHMWTHYKTSPTVPCLKKISLPIKKDPAWLHWQLDVITNKQGKHEAYLHEQYQTPPIHRVLCLLCQTQRVLINPTREPRYTGTQVCDHNVVVSCGYVQNVKFSIQDCWFFSSLQTDFQKIKEKKKKSKEKNAIKYHTSAKVSSAFQSFVKHWVYGWLACARPDRQIYKVSTEPNQEQSANSFSLVSFSAWMAVLCYYK